MTAITPHKPWCQGLPEPTGRFVTDDEFLAALAGPVRAQFALCGFDWEDGIPLVDHWKRSIPYLVDRSVPEGPRYCVVTAVAAALRNVHVGYGDYLDAGATLGWNADRSHRFSAAFDGVYRSHDADLRKRMARALAGQ